MVVFLAQVEGSFEDRLFQIAAAYSAAKEADARVGLFNEMWPALPKLLSSGMRSLSPFVEVMWPGANLGLEPHKNGDPIDRIVTDQENWNPRALSKGKGGTILLRGTFDRPGFLDPNGHHAAAFKEALLSEPPLTVAPIEDGFASALQDAYFVHLPRSQDIAKFMMTLASTPEPAAKIVVFSPNPTAVCNSSRGDPRIVAAWDGDRPVALMLMAACKRGLLPGHQLPGQQPNFRSKLGYWGEFLGK